MVGENLTENTQVFHVKVISTFLRAGIPLNKSENCLKRMAIDSQTNATCVYGLIPFIHKRESGVISEEIKGKGLCCF